jgi:hypothetical protein
LGTVDLVAVWRGLSRGHGGEANLDFGAATSNHTVYCAAVEVRAILDRTLMPRPGAQLPLFP